MDGGKEEGKEERKEEGKNMICQINAKKKKKNQTEIRSSRKV